ncbi:MAG TPA: sigma-70 family RNA polymerase sigma factor [Bacillaceae bacterium]|nr:sigma-70 family RNA polymerase sigma factor [Paenibacillus bovis]HLU22358.1 sigma-70 family RNA polymerase sigma factor [Bacillaceae bacterium]
MVDSIYSAFNRIYDNTKRKTLILITSKCKNPSDIPDIFQDTYAELFSVLSKRGVNYIENEEAFVLKLANQKIYKYYTILEKLKAINPFKYKDDEDVLIELENVESVEILIEDKITENELVEDIHAYLSNKSAEIRKIFYLYYSLGLTISEIASELGISESNVKNKLYRTFSELRNQFKLRGDMV